MLLMVSTSCCVEVYTWPALGPALQPCPTCSPVQRRVIHLNMYRLTFSADSPGFCIFLAVRQAQFLTVTS